FFLGHLGIHKFYLGKIKSGILYILLGIGFWISLVGSFFSAVLVGAAAEEGMKEVSSAAGTGMGVSFILALVCGGVLGILILIDLFTIPKQIRKSYEAKELTVINRIASPANP
ncbi:MAG: NINE protein, partial [Candidatus Aenigmarchaeota archaeon]|nr:NINE protein [Candidatus Aenigmarchaeota archaeon]